MGLFVLVAISSIARRARAPVVRDLVRHPPVRLPGDRPGVRPPARRRGGLRRRSDRPALLDRAVRDRRRARSWPSGSASRSGSRCATGCASPTSSARGRASCRSTSPGATSTGSPIRAGQYFLWRFLARDGWWRGHPFSISAAPNGECLRITVKELGDDSGRCRQSRSGRAVFVEGPYGALTGRPTDEGPRPAHRRRDRDHPAAGAPRGPAGATRRPDPGLPRPRPEGRSCSVTSSIAIARANGADRPLPGRPARQHRRASGRSARCRRRCAGSSPTSTTATSTCAARSR